MFLGSDEANEKIYVPKAAPAGWVGRKKRREFWHTLKGASEEANAPGNGVWAVEVDLYDDLQLHVNNYARSSDLEQEEKLLENITKNASSGTILSWHAALVKTELYDSGGTASTAPDKYS